jgi:succinate dehydrogenase/fumarate reductase cytochrome b subunit
MWDLWWTKWQWDRFFSEFFGFTGFTPFFILIYHLGVNNVSVSGSSSEM